jgi:acyl-CoA thioester hydrolase
MTDITTYRGTVYPWHCDHMGHMNVMWYVGKFDEAVWNLFLEIGLAPSYLRSQDRGMAAVKQSLEYKRELRPGDVVHIRSSVIGLGEKTLTVRQTMTHGEDGGVAATMEAVAVHLDTRLRKAIALPPQVIGTIRARFPEVATIPSKSPLALSSPDDRSL